MPPIVLAGGAMVCTDHSTDQPPDPHRRSSDQGLTEVGFSDYPSEDGYDHQLLSLLCLQKRIMRAVVQRVSKASVAVAGTEVGAIGPGLLVLLGIHRQDHDREADRLADKIVNLRIFADQNDKMNRSLLDLHGEMLIVSQFTLYGDCRKGRRPGYSEAAPPDCAKLLFNRFVDAVNRLGIKTATGRFQATMDVSLINDGPVTLLLDTSGSL